jgi:putative FmdB family regulatory protein
MPVYDYEAKDASLSCPYCREGFECVRALADPRLEHCPKCGSPVTKIISAPAIGRSKSKLDDRARNAGFTKLKRTSGGEYEKLY